MGNKRTIFQDIPSRRPATPLLDRIDSPSQLRRLHQEQLPQVADELREYLLYCVGQTGGHFGAGLGVVELTIALHYVYNTPEDRLIWDVGHQSYPHKILTGRREQMLTMRQQHGLAPFPKRGESVYDTFGVGHSSTSLSAALGMSMGAHQGGSDRKVAAVMGDGAMTAGMAFEALNHAAHTESDLLLVLNDNNMSISRNVGGLASYFAKIWASKIYTSMRAGSKRVLSNMPPAWEIARKTEEHMKGMVSPGTMFEELGFNYIGPIDGHDLDALVYALDNLRSLEGPQLLHVITQKGHGFGPAEADPIKYHALGKSNNGGSKAKKGIKFQDVFGRWLCDQAEQDRRLIGITPAMCEGSGMVEFSQRFPERYHDVAIAEQHAVTLAAGLACEEQKPVVAIYSTFLQRAYDQLIHDVSIQDLDVLFAIDRAGIVGEDGATHSGNFDLSFLRCLPDLLLMTPSDENECRQMLHTGYCHPGPAAVRYPRGEGPGVEMADKMSKLPVGKGVLKRQGKQIAVLAFGPLLHEALKVAEADDYDITVADMRFVKPLDHELIDQLADNHELLITLEDNTTQGGAGSAVLEYLASRGQAMPAVRLLGLPDRYPEHATASALRHQFGLDTDGIRRAIQEARSKLG